jgi:hypothetical protein
MFDVPQKVISLFDDLVLQGEQIKNACKKMYFSGGKKSIDIQSFEAWRTSCLTLLRSTFGTSSPHYDSFINLKFFDHYNSTLLYLGILQGAREDIRKGYFYHKDLMLSVNIFNAFLASALAFSEKGEMAKARGLLEAVLDESLHKLSEAHGISPEQSDNLTGIAEKLTQAHVIPEELRERITQAEAYLTKVPDETGVAKTFAEWQSWLQRFLYEYLGARIVIVN